MPPYYKWPALENSFNLDTYLSFKPIKVSFWSLIKSVGKNKRSIANQNAPNAK